eukprot:2011143-Pyramimonas_sp.AAC.2
MLTHRLDQNFQAVSVAALLEVIVAPGTVEIAHMPDRPPSIQADDAVVMDGSTKRPAPSRGLRRRRPSGASRRLCSRWPISDRLRRRRERPLR